ncbi:MAG: hypothetical protein IBX71_08720, partial [Candidatus Desulforudis sp.]|nr:hypothetical protein [Desulforudis sp.]
LRGVLLAFGLLLAVFSTVFYFLLERYGSFGAMPVNLRIILFVLIVLSVLGIGYLKSRNLVRGARKISVDTTFYKLLKELVTPRILALVVPYLAVTILVIVFLSGGYGLYIIPVLSVLYGLLVISLSSLFFTKEFYYLGIWLTATGLLTLFTAAAIHPLAVLGITFAAGFVLTSLLLYLGRPGEKGQGS